MTGPTFAEYAPWIMFYESTFRNIGNEAGASSATGYFQILKGTWADFGKKVPGAEGFSRAMDAPYLVQYAVAEQVFLGQGITAWETSPKIIASVGSAEPTPAPVPDPVPPAPLPVPELTLATILKLAAALPQLRNAAEVIQAIIQGVETA